VEYHKPWQSLGERELLYLLRTLPLQTQTGHEAIALGQQLDLVVAKL
jgi:hypothetical protein